MSSSYRLFYLILSVYVGIGLMACQKNTCFKKLGLLQQTIYPLSAFDTLIIEKTLYVTLVPDTANFIIIEAAENIIHEFYYEQETNKLLLSKNKTCSWTHQYQDSIHVALHVSNLSFIHYKGNGYIRSVDTLNTSSFSIACFEGGGSVQLILKSDQVHVSLNSGVSDIHLSGQTQNLYLYSGSSTAPVKAENLKSNYVFAINQNVGDFHVQCLDQLDADIRYQGNIYVKGNPPIINATVLGKGKVIRE